MIHALKPYPAYKDSGLPWLGMIPTHWEIRRNGRLFVERNETGFPDLPILEVSLKTGVRVRDFGTSNRKQVMSDREKYKCARYGDIAYNMMRLWQGAVGVAPVDGLVSPAYVVARPLPETESRYYEYAFRTGPYMNEVNRFSRGIVSDRNRLYWEDFKQMPSPFPPPDEQALIARFLDHFGRRVRRYIRAKRRIIDLLNEQKQAIILRAVTRGLDSNARLKPSGLEWIGAIPENWVVRRLKTVARIRYGLGQPPRELAGGLPLLRATNVDHGKIVEKGMLYVDPTDVPQSRDALVREGEIIVVRSGAYTADSAIVPPKYAGAVAGYDMVVAAKTVYPEFLAMTLLCDYVRVCQLIQSSLRAAQPHLNAEDLGTAMIAMPLSEAEQEKIGVSVRRQTQSVDNSIESVEREVDLIREHRTGLVANVVTGKLDVREAAANLPNEEDEMQPGDEPDVFASGDDIDVDATPEEADA